MFNLIMVVTVVFNGVTLEQSFKKRTTFPTEHACTAEALQDIPVFEAQIKSELPGASVTVMPKCEVAGDPA